MATSRRLTRTLVACRAHQARNAQTPAAPRKCVLMGRTALATRLSACRVQLARTARIASRHPCRVPPVTTRKLSRSDSAWPARPASRARLPLSRPSRAFQARMRMQPCRRLALNVQPGAPARTLRHLLCCVRPERMRMRGRPTARSAPLALHVRSPLPLRSRFVLPARTRKVGRSVARRVRLATRARTPMLLLRSSAVLGSTRLPVARLATTAPPDRSARRLRLQSHRRACLGGSAR